MNKMNLSTIRNEMKKIFPLITPNILSSLYNETLMGKLTLRNYDQTINSKNSTKWKMNYSSKISTKSGCIKYFLNIFNILDIIFPDQDSFTEDNEEKYKKFLQFVNSLDRYSIDHVHADILYEIWNECGRYRSINYKNLLGNIRKKNNLCETLLKIKLKDLLNYKIVRNVENRYKLNPTVEI